MRAAAVQAVPHTRYSQYTSTSAFVVSTSTGSSGDLEMLSLSYPGFVF